MIVFVEFLRALAACLITNAHYTGIYPTDLIANGGLLGDVIFFAVSGYCLYYVKDSFWAWYGKRVWRCYLPVIIITAVYMLAGAYNYREHSLLWWFFYPTYYHFVASIVLLYIPYYIIIKTDGLKKRIPFVMLCLGIIAFLVYLFRYDKSYYHIDAVREPFIRFLFLECMLLGAYFRQKDGNYRNHFSAWKMVATGSMLGLYFASKLFFSRMPELAAFQILNQAVLFILLYHIFNLFSGMDGILAKSPSFVKRIVSFLANITLEIYVVQYVLIDCIRGMNLPFPINWICLSGMIVLAAYVLHRICALARCGITSLKRSNK